MKMRSLILPIADIVDYSRFSYAAREGTILAAQAPKTQHLEPFPRLKAAQSPSTKIASPLEIFSRSALASA